MTDNGAQKTIVAAFAAGVLFAIGSIAQGAGQRSFVAVNAVDNPSCSSSTPCRTLAAALLATSPGGEIIAVESGGFGSATISQAVSIISPPGVYAGITVFAGDGLAVNAGPTDKVVLRGLTINGQGGANGIHVQSAGVVHIEQCTVSGLVKGVFFEPNATAKLVVADTAVRNNSSYGLLAQPLAGGVDSVVEVWRSEVTNNGADGIIVFNVKRTAVGDTLSAENNGAGVWVASDAASPSVVHVAIDRAQLIGNLAGVVAFSSGPGSEVTLTHSVIANTNGAGVLANNGGQIALSNNQIAGNTTGTLIVGTGVLGSDQTNLRTQNTAPGDPAAPVATY